MKSHSLKSATRAAKKKNNIDDSEILFLTGKELDAQVAETKSVEKSPVAARALKPKESVADKTPSLKDTLTRINNIGNKRLDDKNANIAGNDFKEDKQTNKKLDDAKLIESFEVFIERIKVDFPRLYSAMKLYPASCSEEGIVTLTFQNNTIVDDFKIRVKPSLLSHLRSSLEAEFIEITEMVVEAEQMERPTIYSDQEKLQHMISKNPNLQRLKSLFNLDFDR